MKHEETVKIIGLLIVAYPSYDKFKDESHIRSTVALWDKMFADDDFGLVQMAVEKHIAKSKWPPSIAELREIMAEITHPELIPVEEAWSLVKKLLAMHERLYAPTNAFLPKLIAEAVDAVGYENLKSLSRSVAQGDSKKAGLDRVAFIQAYENRLQRDKERAVMPKNLRHRIDEAQRHFDDGTSKKLYELDANYQDYQRFMRLTTYQGLPEPDSETELNKL